MRRERMRSDAAVQLHRWLYPAKPEKTTSGELGIEIFSSFVARRKRCLTNRVSDGRRLLSMRGPAGSFMDPPTFDSGFRLRGHRGFIGSTGKGDDCRGTNRQRRGRDPDDSARQSARTGCSRRTPARAHGLRLSPYHDRRARGGERRSRGRSLNHTAASAEYSPRLPFDDGHYFRSFSMSSIT